MKTLSFTLPTLVPPFPDELMLSYAYRLARLNHLGEYGQAMSMMFNKYNISNKYMNTVRLDCLDYLGDFFKFCQFENPEKIYRLTSVVPVNYPFLYDENIGKLEKIIFEEGYKDENSFTIQKTMKHIKLCPKCMEEDLNQYGQVYLHRSHQVCGVNACYKHGNYLMENKSTSTVEYFWSKPRYPKVYEKINDYDKVYSLFVYKLLNDPKSINLDKFTYSFYKETTKRLPISTVGAYELRKMIGSKEHYEFTKKNLEKVIEKEGNPNARENA